MTTIIILFLFLLSLVIQAALLLFLFPKILRNKTNGISNQENIRVSVIVAAHNEEINLKRLIPLLLEQNYPAFEVIIADDRSKDNTIDYLKSIHSEKLNFLSIQNTPKGINSKKYALTQAIEQAKFEFLLFTDADCYPSSPNWLEHMIKNLENKKVILGFSPYEKKNGFLNLFIRYETILTAIQYLSFAIIGFPYMGVGRNLGYMKDLFIENNGFKDFEAAMGGDDDLFIGKASTNSNTSICIEKEANMVSIPKSDWRSFFRQKLRHLSIGKQYIWKQRVIAALYPTTHLLFYLSSLILLCVGTHFSLILGLFILRTLILIVIFALITRKLGDRIKWYWIPVLDLCFTGYYIMTGISAFFYKSAQWK